VFCARYSYSFYLLSDFPLSGGVTASGSHSIWHTSLFEKYQLSSSTRLNQKLVLRRGLTRTIKAVSYGVGEIGSAVARTICEKKSWIDIVGAIDTDSNKVGKDLGEVIDLGKKLNVSISSDLDKVLNDTRPDVVIHTTSSYFSKVYPELESIVQNNVNIVSSCEELAFPYHKEPKLAEKLDLLAKWLVIPRVVTGKKLDPGSQVMQDLSWLVALRNRLSHFKSKMILFIGEYGSYIT
jgi:hypothetical protein